MAEAKLEDFPGLGFVPCPGDATTADDVAKTVRRTAKALDEICQVLHGTGAGDWKGKAAEAFREKFDDEFRPRMDDARDSFKDAATALEDWAAYMDRKQQNAVKLEALAAAANEQLGTAYDKANKLNRADQKTKDTKDHQDKVQDANRAVNSKQLELDELRRKGRRMAKSYQEYGKGIADRLKTAMDIAPNEPGMWDKLGHAIEDLGKALADLPGQVGDLLADVAQGVQGRHRQPHHAGRAGGKTPRGPAHVPRRPPRLHQGAARGLPRPDTAPSRPDRLGDGPARESGGQPGLLALQGNRDRGSPARLSRARERP